MKKDIYIITNDINDKIYVGQSVNTKERFSKHISDAIHNRDNMLIHKAIRKYGKEHFTYAILEHQIENYDEREQSWIQRLNTLQPNGYNIAIG
jgi:group I intron endonuclease